jgi:hypothetical protein
MVDPSPPAVVPNAHVLFREIQGEGILLHLENGKYFGLNDVGTRTWQLIAEHRSLQTVLNCLEDEYDVDAAELRADVLRLVDDLSTNGLIEAAAADR